MTTSAGEGALEIRDVTRTYLDANGNLVRALEGVSLGIQPGEFVSLIGPSGCGKTTLLRLLAGLDKPESGVLLLDGEAIAGTHFERGYVFQQANLFPWATIQDNIATGLKARGVYRERKGEVQQALASMGLTGFGKSFPHQISGGMAQRASLARALVNDPKVLLLDEPLGALDAFTRMDLQDKLLELWQSRGVTMVLVTHDVDEAVYLSDRVVVMTPRPGKIVEIVPIDLPRPRARNDAGFFRLRSHILEQLHLVSQPANPEYYL